MELSNKAQPALKPIKGNNTFMEIFRRSKKLSVPSAYCYVVFDYRKTSVTPPPNNFKLNYAVIVKKKVIRKAVCRNRAKRMLRESIRSYIKRVENPEFLYLIKNIVFYWGKPLERPGLLQLQEVAAAVEELFSKAEGFYKNKVKEYAIEKNID